MFYFVYIYNYIIDLGCLAVNQINMLIFIEVLSKCMQLKIVKRLCCMYDRETKHGELWWKHEKIAYFVGHLLWNTKFQSSSGDGGKSIAERDGCRKKDVQVAQNVAKSQYLRPKFLSDTKV